MSILKGKRKGMLVWVMFTLKHLFFMNSFILTDYVRAHVTSPCYLFNREDASDCVGGK